jgi:hypothetical protein
MVSSVATNIVSGGGGPRPEIVHLHTLSSGLVSVWADHYNYQWENASLHVTNLDTVDHTYTLSLLDRWGRPLPPMEGWSPHLFTAEWDYTLTQSQAQATIHAGQTATLYYFSGALNLFMDDMPGLRAVVTEITPVGAPVSCLPTFEVMSEYQQPDWITNPELTASRVVLEHFRETVVVEYIEVSPTETPTPASTQTRISRGRWREQYNDMREHMRKRNIAASKQRSVRGRSRTKPR